MSKSDAFEHALLDLLFFGTTITGIARNDASPLTDFYLSLHTANPDEGGDQTTHECAYTSYARIPIARDSGAFTRTGSTINPNADVPFIEATGGSETATHWGLGTASSGAGLLLYSGTLSPTIPIVAGIEPILRAASGITED